MKKLSFILASLFFVSPVYSDDVFDLQGVLGIETQEEVKEEAPEPVPAASLGVDLDKNFPPKNPDTEPTNSVLEPQKASDDSSVSARLETLEQNQVVIINKLNGVLRAVEKPQLTKEDVDTVVRKAITELVLPHLTIRSKDGVNRTVPTNSVGGFVINPGETLVAVDGVPVPKPSVVGMTKSSQPIYESVSGEWVTRYTTGENNRIFGGVRPAKGETICINGKCFRK